jgi:hypothetical protein
MIEQLQEALITDEGYRYGWQSNIAMAFYDEMRRHRKWSSKEVFTHDDLHEITNTAADNFLNTLCSQS